MKNKRCSHLLVNMLINGWKVMSRIRLEWGYFVNAKWKFDTYYARFPCSECFFRSCSLEFLLKKRERVIALWGDYRQWNLIHDFNRLTLILHRFGANFAVKRYFLLSQVLPKNVPVLNPCLISHRSCLILTDPLSNIGGHLLSTCQWTCCPLAVRQIFKNAQF